MSRLLVLPLVMMAVYSFSPCQAGADLINSIGTSTISASASVVRGGSGAFDSFNNSSMPATGSGGIVDIGYLAVAGPVIENPPTQSFPGTAGIAESGAQATVDFTLLSGNIGLSANTSGAILATDPAGINAGYSANNTAIARLDFEVDQSTTVRLTGNASHTLGAFWQVQLGGGAIASNYFSSASPGTEFIDDTYTFDPGFNYFIRIISDADIGLTDGDTPQSRTSSVSLSIASVPEPSSLSLVLFGIGAFVLRRHSR